MAQLEVPSYSSESLSHNSKTTLLIGEASDMGFRNMGQLYDDACDVGIALVNPRTGNLTRWYLQDEVRCPRENELLGWMFAPTSESIRKQPELKGYQLNIVND